MNQKLKSLTWRYFWQQKIEEVSVTIMYSSYLLLLFSIFSVGMRILDNLGINNFDGKAICSSQNFICFVVYGFVGTFFFSLILIFIGLLCYLLNIMFGNWIRNNWKKAEKRARKDLIKTRKGGK